MLWRSVALPGSAPHWGCGGRGFKSRRSDHHVEKAALVCRLGGFSCIRPARLPFPKAVERENSMATAFFFISKIGWLLVKPPNCLGRSEVHTSELQTLMRISYDVFCLNNKTQQ